MHSCPVSFYPSPTFLSFFLDARLCLSPHFSHSSINLSESSSLRAFFSLPLSHFTSIALTETVAGWRPFTVYEALASAYASIAITVNCCRDVEEAFLDRKFYMRIRNRAIEFLFTIKAPLRKVVVATDRSNDRRERNRAETTCGSR